MNIYHIITNPYYKFKELKFPNSQCEKHSRLHRMLWVGDKGEILGDLCNCFFFVNINLNRHNFFTSLPLFLMNERNIHNYFCLQNWSSFSHNI